MARAAASPSSPEYNCSSCTAAAHHPPYGPKKVVTREAMAPSTKGQPFADTHLEGFIFGLLSVARHCNSALSGHPVVRAGKLQIPAKPMQCMSACKDADADEAVGGHTCVAGIGLCGCCNAA